MPLVHSHLVQESKKLKEDQGQKLEELRDQRDEQVNQQNMCELQWYLVLCTNFQRMITATSSSVTVHTNVSQAWSFMELEREESSEKHSSSLTKLTKYKTTSEYYINILRELAKTDYSLIYFQT